MVQKFIDAWDKEQQRLKGELIQDCLTGADDAYSYKSLVERAWTIATSHSAEYQKVDLDNLKVFCSGDYSGDYLFIAPLGKGYCGPGDYIYAFIRYGSCSYCDTLLAIQDNPEPDERAQDYWQMILNIIQQTKIMQ